MRKLIRNAVFAAMIGVCCYQIGRIAKYNEIRERANISNEFGEGYFTTLDVEEIVEGYED
jgi:hypothetical protein